MPRVRELEARAGAVHVLFNNNYEDWGMRNARRMTQLLGGAPADGDGDAPTDGDGTAIDGGSRADAQDLPGPRPDTGAEDAQGTLL